MKEAVEENEKKEKIAYLLLLLPSCVFYKQILLEVVFCVYESNEGPMYH